MYGKLFESTYTGSMYGKGATVFAVWGYAIAHTKPDGSVEINPKMLAGAIGESVDEIAEALDFLQRPDDESRTKSEDGKRLIREGEYLFRVVNFSHYRSIRNDEERREYNRQKQAESRARRASSNGLSLTVIEKSAVSAAVSRGQPTQTHASDSDSDSNSNSEKSKIQMGSRARPARKRCPEEFQVTEDLRTWAAKNAPGVNLEIQTASFRDYEFRNGKTDWPAAWRNWMRKATPKTSIPLADRLTWRPSEEDERVPD